MVGNGFIQNDFLIKGDEVMGGGGGEGGALVFTTKRFFLNVAKSI